MDEYQSIEAAANAINRTLKLASAIAFGIWFVVHKNRTSKRDHEYRLACLAHDTEVQELHLQYKLAKTLLRH